jgi:DNA-binding CsgD family transcriptional regulator
MNALAYDVQAPTTDVLLAEVGIPIALHMKDETMLATCARSSSIDFAFRSGQPVTIGNVVGAFAQWYTISNRGQEARVLLHRALEIICNVGYCVQIWILPISIARFGFRKDIPAARHLIEKRTILPCADVAHACLDLFDAFVEQRQGQQSEMQRHAINAIRRFGTLGWHGYAELARTLVPAHMQIRTTVVSGSKPFSDLPHVLTSRELQVAELVLKGLTNREIAKILSIKERTVEAHMTSIMGHLGIRSRHQLVDHFVPG